MAQVESYWRVKGEVDEAAYQAWAAKETAKLLRAVRKNPARYERAGITEANAAEITAKTCSMYRHQFRTLTRAS